MRYPGLLLLCLSMLVVSGQARAQAQNQVLDSALEASGLYGAYAHFAAMVNDRVIAARRECGDDNASIQALAASIGQAYLPADLSELARTQMAARVSDAVLASAQSWYESEAGQAIIRAEKLASELDPQVYAEREAELEKGAQWNESRRKKIAQIIGATKAHHYVATLYLAEQAAFLAAKGCTSSALGTQIARNAMQDVREDRVLMGFMLLRDLQLPTGVTYQQTPDAVLDAYLAFASTSEGLLWHQALVDTLADTLVAQIPRFASFHGAELSESHAQD